MSLVFNKRARHDYTIEDELVAGVVLTGAEVKSLRLGHASLTGSFVKIIGDEAFLLNAQISPYKYADNTEYDPKRTRKLLLKRRELDRVVGQAQQKGRSLVALEFKLIHNRIKLVIGIGRGKKQYEQRETLKRRAQSREIAQQTKASLRGFN